MVPAESIWSWLVGSLLGIGKGHRPVPPWLSVAVLRQPGIENLSHVTGLEMMGSLSGWVPKDQTLSLLFRERMRRKLESMLRRGMIRPMAGGLGDQMRAWHMRPVPWYDTAVGQNC